MSVMNDPKLVQPEGTVKVNQEKRPGWVTWAVIWFALFGIIGLINGVKLVIQINQVDWAGSALQAGIEEGLFKGISVFYIAFTFALSSSMLIAGWGTWLMKKWAALIAIIISAFFAVTQIVAQFQNKVLDILSLVIVAFFVLISMGLTIMWRKRKLT
jgi:hypothetical protein